MLNSDKDFMEQYNGAYYITGVGLNIDFDGAFWGTQVQAYSLRPSFRKCRVFQARKIHLKLALFHFGLMERLSGSSSMETEILSIFHSFVGRDKYSF
jgi:hypothetical protein